MSELVRIDVATWSRSQVLDWLKGLNDHFAEFSGFYASHVVDGKRLLNLTNSCLKDMGITRLRDQETLLQSVTLLQKLTYETSNISLRSLSVKLSVACHNLVNLIKVTHLFNTDVSGKISMKNRVDILLAVENVFACSSSFLNWLDRLDIYNEDEAWQLMKQSLRRNAMIIFSYHKKQVEESVVVSTCEQILGMCCEVIENFKNPIVTQPVQIALVHLTNEVNQELGLEISSLHDGTLYISGIKPNSIAALSKKFELRDEIIQVNGQTVVGWETKTLKEFIKSQAWMVSFAVKKRPCLKYMSELLRNSKKQKKVKSPMSNRDDSHESTTLELPAKQCSNNAVFDEDLLSVSRQMTSAEQSSSLLVRSVDDLLMPGLRSSVIIPQNKDGEDVRSSANLNFLSLEGELKPFDANIVDQLTSKCDSSSLPDCDNQSPWLLRQQQQQQSEERMDEVVSVSSTSPKGPSHRLFTRMRSGGMHLKKSALISSKRKKRETGSCDSMLTSERRDSDTSVNNSEVDRFSLSSLNRSKIFRFKSKKQKDPTKRISCKDLGGADCQGWLWMMCCNEEYRMQGKWIVFWFVLHSRIVYYYFDPQDPEPQGFFHLTNFKVSPHDMKNSKKFIFKVWKPEETYILATDRQQDMIKWMNKMALASLENLDTEKLQTIGGFHAFKKKNSDSEFTSYINLESQQERNSCPLPGSQEADFVKLCKEINEAGVSLEGRNIKQRNSAILKATCSFKTKKDANILKLLTLKRVLTDTEQKLEAIEKLLSLDVIRSEDLKEFSFHQILPLGKDFTDSIPEENSP